MGNLITFIALWTALIISTMGVGLLLVPVYWALVFRGAEYIDGRGAAPGFSPADEALLLILKASTSGDHE